MIVIHAASLLPWIVPTLLHELEHLGKQAFDNLLIR